MSRLSFRIILIISTWILIRGAPTGSNVGGDEVRDPDKDDYMVESEAMKMPILGNFLRYLTTMYADKSDYNWVDKPSGKQPDFCHNYECPKYKVLCKNIFYEVRKYEPTKWVKTPIKWDLKSHGDIIQMAFQRLFNYIKGANIKMTVPVLVQVKKGNESEAGKPACKDKSMKFYLPSEFQKNPPAPTDDQVKIVEAPELVVYVKMFGGYVLPSVWRPMAERFHKVLEEYKQKINPDFGWIGANYDKPSILMNRHNEIIFRAGEEKEDSKYCSLS